MMPTPPTYTPLYIGDDLVHIAHEEGFPDATRRLLQQFSDWGWMDKPPRPGRGRGLGCAKPLWSEQQKNLWLKLLDLRRSGANRESCCNLPIGIWLYQGDTAGVSLRQVQRAMRMWAKAYRNVREVSVARRIAHRHVRQLTEGLPKTLWNRELKKSYIGILTGAPSLDQGDLANLITMALSHNGTAPVPATCGAPISADSESGTLIARMQAVEYLDQFDDATWEWARALMVVNRAEYAYQQSILARDPLRGHVYAIYSEADYMRLAAFGLLTALGLSLLPGWGESGELPPFLDLAA